MWVGLDLGFLGTITLFKKEWSYSLVIFTFNYEPDEPRPPVQLLASGQLNFGGAAPTSSSSCGSETLECTSLGGYISNEEIECKQGDLLFRRFSGVKNLYGGSGDIDLVFRGIMSPTEINTYQETVILDYKIAGVNVISNNQIFLKQEQALLGTFRFSFTSVVKTLTILLPEPEQYPLRTTVGEGCDREWILDGHTSLYINIDQIDPTCSIVVSGGQLTRATFTIDFGFESSASERPCTNQNTVRMSTVGQTTKIEVTRGDGESFTYILPPAFTDFVFKMTNCEDVVEIVDTLQSNGTVTVYGGEDIDDISIGNDNSGTDTIYKSLYINGGGDEDIFTINDAGSSLGKNDLLMASTYMIGLLGSKNATLEFENVEDIFLDLSEGSNYLEIISTASGSEVFEMISR